ncbi:MAG: hypothetical protein AAF353_08840 [Pseudomonadota bacterium]
MKKILTLSVLSSFLVFSAAQTQAATVSLASTIDPNGIIMSSTIFGGYAQISQGDGTPGDADGGYSNADDSLLGTPLDVFPRETAFEVGSIEHADVTGIGVEVRQIDSIDMSQFWTDGSTNNTDISDQQLSFLIPATFEGVTFGPLDANDTVTYTDGVLTSIDLAIDTAFVIQGFLQPFYEFDGTFSIVGNQFAYQIADTELIQFLGANETFTVDLAGSVNAVVPLPPAVLLFGSAILGLLGLSRRRQLG